MADNLTATVSVTPATAIAESPLFARKLTAPSDYLPHDGSFEDEHGNVYDLSYAEFAHRAEIPDWIETRTEDGLYAVGTTHHTHAGVAVTIARVEVWWWCPGIGLVLYVGTDDRVYYWSSFKD